MTALTQTGMNVLLALLLPAAGLVSLTSGVSSSPGRYTLIASFAAALAWVTATIAVNTVRRPRQAVVDPVQKVGETVPQRHVLAPGYPTHVVDVSRPIEPWRWTSRLLAPIELLALSWSVPVLVLLVMLPVGLAAATALWIGRRIFQL